MRIKTKASTRFESSIQRRIRLSMLSKPQQLYYELIGFLSLGRTAGGGGGGKGVVATGFKVKLLRDRSNFNLPKLMPLRKQTFLLAHRRWRTFREEERL